MANEAHFLSTSLSFLSFNKAVLPSKGLSFLVNSRFNRSRQTRTSMEMQGNGSRGVLSGEIFIQTGVPMTSDHSAVKIPHVLTVAGSDSGADAGIQAVLKACAARGVFGTALVKTGMLLSFGIIKILRQQLQEYPIRALVVDPVMVSTSGEVLAGPSILPGFSMSLLYSGVPLNLYSGICTKWSWSFLFGHFFLVANVLVKGGDLPDSLDAIDVFFDSEHLYELRSSHIKTRNTHGTGCTLASCIAAELTKGSSMLEAVKFFVETALDYSKVIFIGNGPRGPFDHLMRLKSNIHNSGRQVRFNSSDLFLEKGIETGDFLEAAKSCLQICRACGVPLLINDRIYVALASDADGVHIGQSDMPAHVARYLLGPRKIIAVSCKTPEQAEQAWLGGADYIGCGGVYPTNTKENNLTVGLDGLKTVCLASKLPVVAIGGINVSNARPVMEMGVPNLKGVAVVSALFDRECVLTETRKLHAVLTEAAAAVN
ncbi:unnamed protein product [Malus baccata var. baccata]